MYTNRTRMVGLSGIDTDTLVKQLMQAESVKYNNLKKQNTMLKWQQEKYRDIGSALKTFQDSFLDILSPTSMRANATFGGYAASAKISGTSTNKVTVKTTKDTKEGSYSLKVSQLAQKSSVTSGSALSSGGKIMSDEGFSLKDADGKDKFTAGDTIKFSLDGVTKTITITSDFLTSDTAFKTKLGEALGTAYGKTFEVSIEGSGSSSKLSIGMTEKGHDLRIYDGTRKNPTSFTGNDLGDDFKFAGGGIAYDFKIGDKSVSVTLENDSDISQIVKKINEAIDGDEDVKKLGVRASVSGNKIVFSSSNTSSDIVLEAGGSNDLLSKIGFDGTTEGSTEGSKFKGKLENTSILSDLGIKNDSSTLGTTSKKLSDLFNLSGFTVDGSGNFKINIPGLASGITVNKNDTLQSLINKINGSDAGVNLKYDSITQKFTMEAKSEGVLNGFKASDIAAGTDMAKLFGFSSASFTEAKDAEFSINGVDSTRATNSFTIDGISITLNEVTVDTAKNLDETITIEVKKDTSKAMDAVKGFVNAYNELIAKINGEVSATRAKNGKYSYYEPLTDDERNAMSESEVKLWEEKAKQGILGRDSILSGITRDMRTAMYQKVEISDGKYLSLFEIGITTTASHWEGGKLAIDEAKLSAAFEEHGEDIAKLFTTSDSSVKGYSSEKLGLGTRLLNIVESAIGSKGTITKKAGVTSRAMSLTTNDMYDQIRRQEDKISDMLARLIEKEDYYYSMFSKMESAISKANSQMEYLSAQLG